MRSESAGCFLSAVLPDNSVSVVVQVQLWSAGDAAHLRPLGAQRRRGSSGSAGGPTCREMEPPETHPHLPNRLLRSHRVPGRRTHQQGHGASAASDTMLTSVAAPVHQ